jgi:hypothetical protein
MPRSSLLLLLVVLAFGAVVWLVLLGGSVTGDDDGSDIGRAGPSAPDAAPPLREDPQPGLEGTGEANDGRRRRPLWPVLPTDKIPRGNLTVTPVDADGNALDKANVTIRLEREGAEFASPPLAQPDYETGAWRFEKVVIGWVKVIAFGDHIEESRARANIEAGRTNEVKVTCRPSGMIRYTAKLYSGEAPEKIALKLLHPRTKRPATAYWEVRQAETHAAVRRAAQVVQGPQGVVFGMPAGKWILHATSEEDEIDQQEVEVRPGETTEVEVLLRK